MGLFPTSAEGTIWRWFLEETLLANKCLKTLAQKKISQYTLTIHNKNSRHLPLVPFCCLAGGELGISCTLELEKRVFGRDSFTLEISKSAFFQHQIRSIVFLARFPRSAMFSCQCCLNVKSTRVFFSMRFFWFERRKKKIVNGLLEETKIGNLS